MNPRDMSGPQIKRLIGLTLAVIWTAAHDTTGQQTVGTIADDFVVYIESGKMPRPKL